MQIAPGINIWSGSTVGLGAALTNPTALAKRKGKLKNDYAVKFEGKIYPDAEHCYQAVKHRTPPNDERTQLMISILIAKLQQHPRLVEAMGKNGGAEWLKTCSHKVPTAKNHFWEGAGTRSLFIQCLIAAYKRSVSKITPEQITTLERHQICVFGSNSEGRHGAGLALLAYQKFGAKHGIAKGFSGNSYAIVTKDLRVGTRSIPLPLIEAQIDEMLEAAKTHPNLEFLVTKIGCGLAGYSSVEIGYLFKGKYIPDNVLLPQEFITIK